MIWPSVVCINKVLQLAPNNFDKAGDIHFPNPKGEIQQRGGFSYYQPKKGWQRFGLSVNGIYPEGEKWLSMNGAKQSGSWMVAFHGTNSTSSDYGAVTNIISTRTLLKGNANAYGGKKATNRLDPIPRIGIYLSLDIEHCYKQTVKTASGNYELAFQCRVHPIMSGKLEMVLHGS